MSLKKSTLRLLATDWHGSILHDQERATAYLPFGYCPISALYQSMLRFNGQPLDISTGGYLLGNGYRIFHSVLMRFSTPDRLSPFGEGGVNCYAYCAGDPVNRVDPSGKNWILQLFLRTKPEPQLVSTHDPQLPTFEGARKLQKLDGKIAKYKARIERLEHDLEIERAVNTFLSDTPAIERSLALQRENIANTRVKQADLLKLMRLDGPPSYDAVVEQDAAHGLPPTYAMSQVRNNNT